MSATLLLMPDTFTKNMHTSLLLQCYHNTFFCDMGLDWDPKTQARWLSLASFICSGSILAKPKVYILTFYIGHSHKRCTNVSFSAPHLLHEGVFALLILCRPQHLQSSLAKLFEPSSCINFFVVWFVK